MRPAATAACQDRTADVRNPHDNSLIGSVRVASDQAIELALRRAEAGRAIAKALPRHRRSDILHKAAGLIRDRRDEFASRITSESGKTVSQALKETDRCVNTLTLSAEEAKRIAGEEIPFDSYPGLEDRFGYYTREPLGIVVAITPFNDPLNLVAHKVGPAIAAGCACLLKPALETPFSAMALVDCLYEAGLPTECLQVVIGGADVGDALVRDTRVSMVTFTGGAGTGKLISRAAGLKRIAMDLGGNAPVFVLSDADIETAAADCASGAFWAAGQNCIGVQRIFCHEAVFDTFQAALVTRVLALKTGDPALASTDMGPMISQEAACRIEAWVEEAIEAGATCLTGHRRMGAHYAPTVLVNVPHTARILCEEAFAPVVCLLAFSDLDDALAKANEPDFLLHGAVFTHDLRQVQKLCDTLDCSGIMINDSSDFRFDGMPFGGSKCGALGREGVKFAIEEMTQTKVVCYRK